MIATNQPEAETSQAMGVRPSIPNMHKSAALFHDCAILENGDGLERQGFSTDFEGGMQTASPDYNASGND